jgi:hypothetical protein
VSSEPLQDSHFSCSVMTKVISLVSSQSRHFADNSHKLIPLDSRKAPMSQTYKVSLSASGIWDVSSPQY